MQRDDQLGRLVPSVLKKESGVKKKKKNTVIFFFLFLLGPLLGEWCTPSIGAVILKGSVTPANFPTC